jgi:hypothetical protein
MYQLQPDLKSLSQAQLLQLLVLADRYGVNKVLVAAVAVLQAVPQAELQWETVLGVYALPPGCADVCQPLLPALQRQLQLQLGDLELAMSDDQKRQQLRALPYKLMLQLLEDYATKVASENTGDCCLLDSRIGSTMAVLAVQLHWLPAIGSSVLPGCLLLQPPDYIHSGLSQGNKAHMRSCSLLHAVFRAIQFWNVGQKKLGAGPSDSDLVQLLQQIRMQHCTQPFVATVLAESPLAAKCFTPRDLRLACICSNTGAAQSNSIIAAMEEVKCPTLAKFPAWHRPKRPTSAMTKLVLEREVG